MSTVPARALISDSFKNWRFMYASGGRRLQREVLLDVHAVRPLTPSLLAKFPTLAGVWKQIAAGELPADDILIGDAMAQPTNLGIYRVYLTGYLQCHPRVSQEMTRLVRQLQVKEDGLPLEITVYLLDTGWPNFETGASSIFEHIFATLPQFGLRPFQRPHECGHRRCAATPHWWLTLANCYLDGAPGIMSLSTRIRSPRSMPKWVLSSAWYWMAGGVAARAEN